MDLFEALRPAAGLLLFFGFWSLVLFAIAWVGGWRSLARTYRDRGTFAGRTWWFESARMNFWTGYNGSLIVGVDPGGLYLAVLFPFRPGHPPLYLPWSQLSASSRPAQFFPTVQLHVRTHPRIVITISRRLYARIEDRLGHAPTGPVTA